VLKEPAASIFRVEELVGANSAEEEGSILLRDVYTCVPTDRTILMVAVGTSNHAAQRGLAFILQLQDVIHNK